MSSLVDLSQFGQWLVEHQGKVVKELWCEQNQVQESLIKKDFCDSLKLAQASPL